MYSSYGVGTNDKTWQIGEPLRLRLRRLRRHQPVAAISGWQIGLTGSAFHHSRIEVLNNLPIAFAAHKAKRQFGRIRIGAPGLSAIFVRKRLHMGAVLVGASVDVCPQTIRRRSRFAISACGRERCSRNRQQPLPFPWRRSAVLER